MMQKITFGGLRANRTSNACRTTLENLAPIGVQSDHLISIRRRRVISYKNTD